MVNQSLIMTIDSINLYLSTSAGQNFIILHEAFELEEATPDT